MLKVDIELKGAILALKEMNKEVVRLAMIKYGIHPKMLFYPHCDFFIDNIS